MNSLKCSFISPLEATDITIQCLIAKIFKAYGTYDYCYKLKRKQKYFKMYKYIKISNILWNLVATVVTKPRNKCLNLNLLWRLNYSSLETGCYWCSQTELQIERKTIWKNDEAQKPHIRFWKQVCSKVITELRFQGNVTDSIAAPQEANWGCY